jgi:histidinol dehydrogenase
MKKTSVLSFTRDAFMKIAPATVKFAEAEGLDAHARAARVRMETSPHFIKREITID